MPREPIIKKAVIEILKDGPKTYTEIKKCLQKKLRRKIKDGVLTYALKSLENEGAVEKLADGRWTVGQRYPLLLFKSKIDDALLKWNPVVVENYGALLDGLRKDDLALDYWRMSAWGLRAHFWDAASLFLSRVYTDYAGYILDDVKNEDKEKIIGAILKLTYLGYLMHENRKELKDGVIYRTLAEKEGKKKIEDFDLEKLSDFFLDAWNFATEEEDWFVYNLWDSGAVMGLISLALSETGGKWIRRSLEELRDEAPSLARMLKQKLFEKLADLRLAFVIYLDKSVHAKPLSFVHVFERWLEALRVGALDHRSYIFEYAPSILAKFKRYIERKHSGIGISIEEEKEFENLLQQKIDLSVSWALGDLYQYHPRGKSPKLYEEILEEIELRRPHLERRKLGRSISEASFNIRSKLRPEALEKIRQALGFQKSEGRVLKYSDLWARLKMMKKRT